MTIEDPQSRGQLRPVERADLLAVTRIEDRTFDRPWTLSTFESFLDAPAFLVLEDPMADEVGERVAGFVVGERMTHRGNQIGHVKDLAVKPKRQGAGRGHRLITGTISKLARLGAERVRLEVRPTNDRARSLYESVGFEVLTRQQGYYPDGEDALLMVRPLRKADKDML